MLAIQQKISPLPADKRSHEELGLPEFNLDQKVLRLLDSPGPEDWTPTDVERSSYLDIMEHIVRQGCAWQDKKGTVRDPYISGREGLTSARLASPGAILLAFGRIPELREEIFRTMDWSCAQLPSGEAKSPDFWLRELATAYMCLESIAEPDRLAKWQGDLQRVVPEEHYWQVESETKGVDELHNWTVYAAGGEVLRDAAGIGSKTDCLAGTGFFEKYMPAQLKHFTSLGMYRDPNDPITYDITTRLQFLTALAFGYQGTIRGHLEELLRRGALTTLLFMSPEGFVPYGGRSAAFHFEEAIICALAESEARRYKNTDPRLAGAFKHQARLSLAATERWIVGMTPMRHIKNGFDPADGFGIDSYGHYSVYSLLIASFLGLAAVYADEDIEEAPCPAENGGFALELDGAFHKVFATCRGTSIEIDTQADLHYDATGLGRFLRRGCCPETALAMPFTATPNFLLPEQYIPREMLAIGSAWQLDGTWTSLASLSKELKPKVTVLEESTERVRVHIHYGPVVEEYALEEGEVKVRATVVEDAEAVRFTVPLIVSDGSSTSDVSIHGQHATVAYREAAYTIQFDPSYRTRIDDTLCANRNGLYKTLILMTEGNDIEVLLSLQ